MASRKPTKEKDKMKSVQFFFTAVFCGAAVLAGGTAFGTASTFTVDGNGDVQVSSGDGYSLRAEDSERLYRFITLYSDLTIDGESCGGLTNSQSVMIAPWLSSPPAIITVTNGARWVIGRFKPIKFSREGGTIVVSEPSARSWEWGAGSAVVTPLAENTYPNMIGTIGWLSPFTILDDVEADGGTMDILRLLPNGTASVQYITNGHASVAARILFEGGELVSIHDTATKFQTVVGSKIILQSVDSKPIVLRTSSYDYCLFSGEGTLETAGNGDFILLQHYTNTKTIMLGADNGNIVWGHTGDFLLGGRMCLKLTSNDVLPHGEGKGRVVFCVNNKMYGVGSSAAKPVVLDLNGQSATVNALVQGTGDAAYYSKWHVVTNSAEDVATLGLDVYADKSLHEIMTTNLAGNAALNIRLKKVGSGKLTINNDKATNILERVAGTEVADGTCYFYKSYVLTRPLSVTGGGSIQVREDVQYTQTLDLSAIADEDLSIGGLTVVANPQRQPTITKFRSAENGNLYLTNVEGKLESNSTVPITLSSVVDAENFSSWKVYVNGIEARSLVPAFANGVLKVRSKSGGAMIVFR